MRANLSAAEMDILSFNATLFWDGYMQPLMYVQPKAGVGDSQTCPFSDESLEMIWSRGVLEKFENLYL